jgi:hypothetical protein
VFRFDERVKRAFSGAAMRRGSQSADCCILHRSLRFAAGPPPSEATLRMFKSLLLHGLAKAVRLV